MLQKPEVENFHETNTSIYIEESKNHTEITQKLEECGRKQKIFKPSFFTRD